MKKLKQISKVAVIIIVILIFVMSYVDFGVRNPKPTDVVTPIVNNPTSSPSVVGPITPPPINLPTYPTKKMPSDLEFLMGNSTTTH